MRDLMVDIETCGTKPGCAVLSMGFNAVGVRCPWKFWNVRDVRTAVDLLGINPKEFTRDGTYHNALDDCLHQIKYLTSGTKTL